jgi:hypothetical protein
MTLSQIVNAERIGHIDIKDSIIDCFSHDETETHLSIMLDWAMQIRNDLGIEWGECIRISSILYYG